MHPCPEQFLEPFPPDGKSLNFLPIIFKVDSFPPIFPVFFASKDAVRWLARAPFIRYQRLVHGVFFPVPPFPVPISFNSSSDGSSLDTCTPNLFGIFVPPPKSILFRLSFRFPPPFRLAPGNRALFSYLAVLSYQISSSSSFLNFYSHDQRRRSDKMASSNSFFFPSREKLSHASGRDETCHETYGPFLFQTGFQLCTSCRIHSF